MSDWKSEAELVGKLSATMLAKLEANRWKEDWKEASGYLRENVHESVRKFMDDPSWENAADIANFAAMVADVEDE